MATQHHVAIMLLEANGIEWLYTSQSGNKNWDVGYLPNIGILQLNSVNNNITNIKLCVNLHALDNIFLKKEGKNYIVNYMDQFPTGDGNSYQYANIKVIKVFAAIEEIKLTQQFIFPFLKNSYWPEAEILEQNFKFDPDERHAAMFAFLKHLTEEHKQLFNPVWDLREGTGYYSQGLEQWNRINLINKMQLGLAQWNNADTEFTKHVTRVLTARTINHSIQNFINNAIFSDTMQCGLNISHVLALIEQPEIKELVYSKLVTLPNREELFATSDQLGLTAPFIIIKNHSMINEIQQEVGLDYFERILKISEKSINNSKASFLDVVSNCLGTMYTQNFINIFSNNKIAIPKIYHIVENKFSEDFIYKNCLQTESDILNYIQNNHQADAYRIIRDGLLYENLQRTLPYKKSNIPKTKI